MSLRLRLFVLFGGLLVALLAVQHLWVRSLTHELSSELTSVADEVSQAVVAVLEADLSGEERAGAPAEDTLVVGSAVIDGSGLPLPTQLEGLLFGLGVELTIDGGVVELIGPAHQRQIPIQGSGVRQALDRFRERLLLASLAVVGIGLCAAAWGVHRATAPLRTLARTATRVGQGELGLIVDGPGHGEIGSAIVAFNQMSQQLLALDHQARQLQAQAHLSELGEIGRGFAHTLRNPLNALGLALDELSSTSDEEARAALVIQARRQIHHVDEALRAFLALASEGAHPEALRLQHLVEDVVLATIQQSPGRVRIDLLDADGDDQMHAVPQEIRAMVQALVVNAVEASPVGGQIRIQLHGGDEALQLEITDQGPGVDPSVRPRLFQPHVTTKATGSGMGLFLASRLAQTRYQGTITLEDAPGGGTRATARLSRTRTGAADGR